MIIDSIKTKTKINKFMIKLLKVLSVVALISLSNISFGATKNRIINYDYLKFDASKWTVSDNIGELPDPLEYLKFDVVKWENIYNNKNIEYRHRHES